MPIMWSNFCAYSDAVFDVGLMLVHASKNSKHSNSMLLLIQRHTQILEKYFLGTLVISIVPNLLLCLNDHINESRDPAVAVVKIS